MKKVVNKKKKSVATGIAFVNATFNNTIVTITDQQGQVITWSSAGKVGFKGSKKSTPYAAQIAAEDAAQRAIQGYGMKTIMEAKVKGPGSGKESAVRAIGALMSVAVIKDLTPVPHNGCRPPKRRRV